MPCFLGKAQLGPLAVKWILDLTSHCSSGSKRTVTELSCCTLSLRTCGLGTAAVCGTIPRRALCTTTTVDGYKSSDQRALGWHVRVQWLTSDPIHSQNNGQKEKLNKTDKDPGSQFTGKCPYTFSTLLSLHQSFQKTEDMGFISLPYHHLQLPTEKGD